MQPLLRMIVVKFVTTFMIFFAMVGHTQEIDDGSWTNYFATEVESASGTEENLRNAPATMVVITAKEIKQRGYTDLTEVIKDLPGFDVVIANGTAYMVAYQRGYRTNYTTRTLFMVNGVVDNMLWAHEAAITRQYPLSNIKKIEVLYGPAGAVYGPNAFLGVINVITYDGTKVKVGEIDGTVNAFVGSDKSIGVDATVRGKPNEDISFSISGKVFQSDEPDFTGEFGFLEQEQFSNRDIWGSLLDLEHEGNKLGSYSDPTEDYGVLADLQYKGVKLGWIHWKRKEAYGPYYAADRVQNNAFWNKDSNQFFAEYDKDWTDRLKSHSLLLYRENRRYGYWGEASPAAEGKDYLSDISFTHFNSVNNSWLFKQNFEFILREDILLSGGFKYERKELTKAYDIPGYWKPAVSSSADSESGIKPSNSDEPYVLPKHLFSEIPAYNLAHTRDFGGYIQGIFDVNLFRFNVGLRYDKNSMYGSVWNPRASAIYKVSKPLTFKLLYGEAFQEPAPLLLWGGWSGRKSNPNMKPEKVQNLEFVAMHQFKRLFHEISIYGAYYRDVIKEEANNAGERDIYGIEYRAKYSFSNFIPNSSDITGYFNYTFTDVTSSMRYNPAHICPGDTDCDKWEDGDTNLGDIAPHKFNIGLNMPIGKDWNFNLRGNFVGERELYSRNPLREQGEKLESYFTLDGVIGYQYKPFEVSFKVLNILDEDYFHPGVESANSGNNFTQRSQGFMNSIIPQPGRSFWLSLGMRF
jgi:outer membrane receptor for ferrienterochelin and colicins